MTVDIRNMSKDQLLDLTDDLLSQNTYLTNFIKDRNIETKSVSQKVKQLNELVNRVENLVLFLNDYVETKSGNPKTKSYKSYSNPETPYPYVVSRKEGSVRLL